MQVVEDRSQERIQELFVDCQRRLSGRSDAGSPVSGGV